MMAFKPSLTRSPAALRRAASAHATSSSAITLSSSLRYSITNNQAALSKASTEATTGRFADVGLELGATTGGDVSLRADLSFADQLVDTNGLVSGRLDVTQNRITQLERPYSADELKRASNYLNEQFRGRTLAQVRQGLSVHKHFEP